MERIEIDHASPSFILTCKINEGLCDEILQAMDDKSHMSRYDEVRGYHRLSDRDMDSDLMKRYMRELDRAFQLYKKVYKWSNTMCTEWSVMSPFNLQKYDPGDCYMPIHIEDGGPRKGKIMRNLAFVTYLNDIEEGGETEFLYQGIMVKPQKGLTTIFPAGWTHPHRGHPAYKEVKYIVTGWSSYHHRC